MKPAELKNKQIKHTELKNKNTIANYLNSEQIRTYLEQELGTEKRQEFISNLISLSQKNKNLSQCNPQDIMLCALQAVSLNLSLDPGLGLAYIVAFSGIAQFQIGYKGLIQLALRSNLFETMNATIIRENEIQYNKLNGHVRFIKDNPKGDIIGYVAYFKLLNGFEKYLYLTTLEVQKHASKYSKMYNNKNGLWTTSFDTMALKTVLKKLLSTYAPLSIQYLVKAIKTDQTNAQNEYFDNPQCNNYRDNNDNIIPQSDDTSNVKL